MGKHLSCKVSLWRCPSVRSRGAGLRLIDSCITQLKAQRPSRTCNESKEEEEVWGRTCLARCRAGAEEVPLLVNRGSTFALRRSTLDFCLGGQRSKQRESGLASGVRVWASSPSPPKATPGIQVTAADVRLAGTYHVPNAPLSCASRHSILPTDALSSQLPPHPAN